MSFIRVLKAALCAFVHITLAFWGRSVESGGHPFVRFRSILGQQIGEIGACVDASGS